MSYYQMHRGWMDNALFRNAPLSKREAWCWLIENARYKNDPLTIGTNRGDVTVNKGQLSYSYSYLADAWKWHVSAVRRFIFSLSDRNMIVTQADTTQMIITICNYSLYQDVKTETDKTSTGHRQDVDRNTNKGNKVNNTYTDDFSTFWSVFPTRSGNSSKKDAFSKYKTAIKSGAGIDEILSSAKRYFKYCEEEGNIGTQFVQAAKTWLHQEGWNNNYATKKQTPKKNGQDLRRSTADQLNLTGESDAQRSLRELAERGSNV